MNGTKVANHSNAVWRRGMAGRSNSTCISLASIVLDVPDQTGQYIAKDFAGGWAYLVTDGEGDALFRGQGSHTGNVAGGMQYAFLSALACVPETRRLTVFVDTPQAHRQMVQLATSDAGVVASIGGRPLSIMTRPKERSSFKVRSAAERVALATLHARELSDSQAAAETVVNTPEETKPAPLPESMAEAVDQQHWRSRWGAHSAAGGIVGEVGHRNLKPPVDDKPAWLRSESSAEESCGLRAGPRSGVPTEWLHELDSQVGVLTADLQTIGR